MIKPRVRIYGRHKGVLVVAVRRGRYWHSYTDGNGLMREFHWKFALEPKPSWQKWESEGLAYQASIDAINKVFLSERK